MKLVSNGFPINFVRKLSKGMLDKLIQCGFITKAKFGLNHIVYGKTQYKDVYRKTIEIIQLVGILKANAHLN